MSQEMQLRIPPHSLEAEQAVLGGLMLEDSAWDKATEYVSGPDFYRKDHRLIFEAIGAVSGAGKPRDALTVAEALTDMGQINEIGGLAYLGELVKNTPSAANISAYAEIVRERALRRLLIRTAHDAAVMAWDGKENAATTAAGALDAIQTVIDGATNDREVKSAKEAGRQWLDRQNAVFNAGTTITGIRNLDKHIRGLNNKHLLLIAARPSMGKSTLAVNIAVNILRNGGSVYLATMEMSSDDVMNQMCAALTGCSYELIQCAALGEDSVREAQAVFASMLRGWKLSIDDRGTQTVQTISRGVRRHARMHGKPVVIVDYAQLMSDKGENETVRIGEISRGMKLLAQDYDLPAILLSQLNRDLEKRPDKRPMLSDLRGSGSLEQDASEVLFLYDDQVYNPERPTDYTELLIAKNRHGRRGLVVPLLKQLDKARFVTPEFVQEKWRGFEREEKTEKRARRL